MSVNVTPHLNFRGEAREALEFYQSVFGGEVMIATYSDSGVPKDAPDADKVVWGQVAAENGFRVMAYDVALAGQLPRKTEPTRQENGVTVTQDPFYMSVRGDSEDEISAQWEKLSEGAKIVWPLGESQWSPLYGMLTNRFGVTWVLDVAVEYQA